MLSKPNLKEKNLPQGSINGDLPLRGNTQIQNYDGANAVEQLEIQAYYRRPTPNQQRKTL